MTWWYCPKCGKLSYWKPRWVYIARNVDYMIEQGLAEPRIKGGKFMGIKRHPTYLHPHCAWCGAHTVWVGRVIRRRRGLLAEIYIFEGKLII